MKTNRKIIGGLLVVSTGLILGSLAFSQNAVVVDDSDLSSPVTVLSVTSTDLEPDRIIDLGVGTADQVQMQFLYQRNNTWIPIEGLSLGLSKSDNSGNISFECTAAKKLKNNYKIKLGTDKFTVTAGSGFSGSKAYQLLLVADCGNKYRVEFDEQSISGQAISIFETLRLGEVKLAASVGVDYWNKNLQVVWPDNSDYYSFGTLHISLGHQWDVVGHEFGHAIYDFGNLGQFGGGQHKIDECYSDTLALSEGWATFFAAWLYIDLADSDAKFQYLVPRRAPIRIEHIPADVCRGIKNEWRVSGFFWDVIDANQDGEISNQEFAKTWNALFNSNSRNVMDARQRFQNKGIDQAQLEQAWQLNF